MNNSTKFSVAVHIAILVAVGEGKATSKWIAGSVNTNPVVIRRIASLLQKSDIISANQGEAGYQITRNPNEITLFDIYKAIQNSDNDLFFKIHENTNVKCHVGESIQSVLNDVQEEAMSAVAGVFEKITIQQLIHSCSKNH